MTTTRDYIIIGGGTSSCVLANRLSEAPRNNVLLLEALGKNKSPLLNIPIYQGTALKQSKYVWQHFTEADETRESLAE